ncbi:MAG: aminotransferase class IV [Bacteroidales bacterium]
MESILFNTYIKNDILYQLDESEIEIDFGRLSIYEVIRIDDFTPLFLNEHYKRFCNSSKYSDILIPSKKEFQKQIEKIISHCQQKSGNVKIISQNNINNNNYNCYYFFIPHYFPKDKDFTQGVETIFFDIERKNPQSKAVDINYKKELGIALNKSKAYEAMIVNKEAYITEGSKSNLFFIKGHIVYTSPIEYVLPGITREKIEQICAENKIPLIHKLFSKEDVLKSDAAFISGTSPKVLPIAKIENKTFDVRHPIIQKISTAYDRYITQDIESHKKQ